MLRTTGSWDSVYRSQMDSVMRGHWACNLQTVTLKELKSWCYIYSTGPVLSTELSQTVAKELVTNELTFNTCEPQSQDQDSPVPESSAATITFNPCESQSQDQDSPVPELSVSTTANRLVIYPCHRTK